MREAGRRMRNLPAPPHAVFEALTRPDRDPSRPWLLLLDDEIRPRLLATEEPHEVVWSSLWPGRPDAQIHFSLPPGTGSGTDLCWTLLVDDPPPDPSKLGHMRKRINELIHADLRYSFGQ